MDKLNAPAELPDGDALLALADLIDRAHGRKGFDVGYIDDDPLNVTWWAVARFSQGKVKVEGYPTAAAAADALAARILDGGQCPRCRLTTHLAPRNTKPRRTTRSCLWARDGDLWVSACFDRSALEERRRQAEERDS